MSKLTKLLKKIKNLDKCLRFDEVCKVLLLYGYELNFPHGGSSHATFRKTGKMPITIPTHEPVKKIYVSIVKDAIERIDNNE